MYKKLTLIIILISGLIACSQNFYNKKLMKAIGNNDTYKVSSILEKQKVNINYISESKYEYYYGMTPLTLASDRGNYPIVKLLVDKGAGVNIKDGKGSTALIEASETGSLEIVKYLIENGADINAKDKNGETALMISLYKNLEIVKYLVRNGADINAKDNDGETALMIASKYRNLEIVKYLVENGANVNVQNNDGKTAFDLMVIRGDAEIESEEIEKRKEEIIKEAIEIGKVLKGIR